MENNRQALEKLKIIFMGTPEFGAIILEKLCQTEYKPVLAITPPDKPVGRKQIVTPPPVKISAEKYGIDILQPEKIQSIKQKIRDLNPDLIVLVAYGQIIPKEMLDMPKYGSINIHPSLLPKYRGPSPIQNTILNGDEETGITIIKMSEKIDAGPILTSSKIKITNSKITYSQLMRELTELGANLLIETIPQWTKGAIQPKPQEDSKAIYTNIIKKEDGRIDWQKPADFIERQVRALNHWPSAYTFIDLNDKGVKQLKILKASVQEQTKDGPFGTPGKTFLATNDKVAVQTGKHFLIIEELQIEGKKPMPVGEFLKGHLKFIGNVLK